MVVFHKLHRTARSSRVHRTKSVSVTGHVWLVHGSVFHRVRSEMAKLLCPYVVILEHGIARSPCVAEWRCLQLTDEDSGVTISAR